MSMSEDGAGGHIYMDIKSILHAGSLNSVIGQMTSMFGKAGDDVGGLFGRNASSAIAKKLAGAQGDYEKAMSAMVGSTNKFTNAGNAYETQQKRVNEVIKKYGAESSQASSALDGLVKRKQNLTAASREVESATNAETRAHEALDAATAKAGKSSGALGVAATTAGVAITGGFVVGVGMAIKKAADFQTTQTRLVTSAGESASALKTVSDGILNMAGQVGMSAQQLSAGMYTVESAGYHGADSLRVLQAAAQGAKMEGAELHTVADAVSTALSDYHLPAAAAATVTSQLVTAVGQGKTTMEEFSGSLHSITPFAASVGISLADVTGSVAELTSHGWSADQAAQNLAHTLQNLVSNTNPVREELAQLGLTTDDVQKSLGSRGMAGTIEFLSRTVLAKMGPDGELMLNSFNSSRDAAKNLQAALAQLPPDLKGVAQQFANGTISLADWRTAIKTLPANQQNLAASFTAMYNKANGFTTAMKNGSPQAQNYNQAMIKLTGTSDALKASLALTGENAAGTSNNIRLISAATADAGGNVKGWADIQGTYNQRMAQFKDGISAAGIKIGNDFLPAATSVVGVLGKFGSALSRDKPLLDGMVIAVGGIAAAFVGWKTISGVMAAQEVLVKGVTAAVGLFTTTTEASTIATQAATVAQGELDVALDANPIGAVVLAVEAAVAAIAALGVGAYEAYKHFGWFRTAVNDTWHVLRGIGEWIGSAFAATWRVMTSAIGPVEHAFGNLEHAGGNVEHALGNVEHAIGNVVTVLKYAGAIVATVIAVPFVLAFKAAELAATALYEHGIKQSFTAIASMFHWVYDTAVQPVIGFIKDEIHGWAIVANWLHDSVIQPVGEKIGAVFHWIYDNAVKPVVANISDGIHAWGATFSWVHDAIIKPVGDKIGQAMDGVKDVFKSAVDWVETQWGRIENILKVPTKFIVDVVYNNAILPVWNDIAGVFGLSKISPVDVSKWSGGGIAGYSGGGVAQGPQVLPGYAPGRDTEHALLSKGEGIAVPELVQAIGPSNFMALNHAYSGGRKPGGGPAYSGGGIFGDIGDAIGDAATGNISGLVGSAWSGLKDSALLAKIAANPAGSLHDLFSKAEGLAGTTPGDPSTWRDALIKTPGKFVSAAIDKVTSWFTSHLNGSVGTAFVPSADLMRMILQAEQITGVGPSWTPGIATIIGRESSGNRLAINRTDSNAQAGDPSRGLMQTINSTFESYRDKSLPDDIYDGLANIVAGINYIKARYGDIGNVQQANPAMPPKGYAGGGISGEDDVTGDETSPADQPLFAWSPDYLASIQDNSSSTSGSNSSTGTGTSSGDATKGTQTDPKTGVPAVSRAMSWLQPLLGHAYTEGGMLDCSGIQSGIFQTLVGGDAGKRAFSTISDFAALGFKSGSGGLYDIGVLPLPGDQGHMVGRLTVDGVSHYIESAGGKGVVMDGKALHPDAAMFRDHWYLPGSAFSPPYTGEGGALNTDQKHVDRLSKKAERDREQAAKDQELAQKENAEAQKYLAEAAKSDALAASTSGATKQRHIGAAARHRDEASRAKTLADKHTQKAKDLLAQANQADMDAKVAGGEPMDGKHHKKRHKGEGSSESGVMTLHELFSRAGGDFADAITDTTGLGGWEKTVENSPFFKIGSAVGSVGAGAAQKYAAPGAFNPLSGSKGPTAKSLEAEQRLPRAESPKRPKPKMSLFDEGGWLMPGELGMNLTGQPEPILAPREKDNLEAIAKGANHFGNAKAMVVIEQQNIHRGDEHRVGKSITRSINAYAGSGSR